MFEQLLQLVQFVIFELDLLFSQPVQLLQKEQSIQSVQLVH
jgi:hypothetical protein